jgi:hypothetical protein
MVMRVIFCVFLLAATPLQAATTLQASVDKNPVLAGEFFMLNIAIDDSIKNDQPDTSSLLKDFVVGPTSMSSRTNIINGAMNKQTTWSVKLMTRKEGEYTIPAFSVAGLTSQPIQLKVAKRAVDADKNNDIFLKASLSTDSLFVQEAGVYTVKLYLAKELLDGSLSSPAMEDAQLTQLGKQTEGYELVDGKRYLVITREYLLQPQKSGVYTIQAPAFEGRVQQNYRQLAVSALGEDLTVEIKPIPNDYQGAWLPSELVSLDEQWQPNENSVEVGTPITRTITLTALGVTKEQLPDITLPDIQGIRSYPDDKENNNAVRNGRIVSQQTASYALLPQIPGTYTLPEVSLPWFNTKINRMSFATLPARTITVTPSANAALNSPASVKQTPAQTNNSDNPQNPQPTITQLHYPLWLIVIAIVGYLLWIITAILFWVNRSTKEVPADTINNVPKAPALDALRIFAKQGNNAEFYKALMVYAAQLTKQPQGGLDTLCKQINDVKFNETVRDLQTQLYSTHKASVDLNIIIKLLNQHQIHSSTSDKKRLSALY